MGEPLVEKKRAAHYAHFCDLMPELITRLSWSRQRIDAYKTGALRDLIRHAQEHSPWHARRLSQLDPSAVTLADLARIPPMTKNDLMENWDEIVTVPGANLREGEEALRGMRDQFYIWGDNVLFASGGTGGRPGIFLYDWTALALNWAGMARVVPTYVNSLPIRGNTNPKKISMVAIGAEPSAHGSFIVGRVFSNPNNSMHLLSGWRSAEELVPKLNAIQPDLISCYPTLMPALAAAANAGALRIQPQVIACGGEHFPEHSRQLAREAWPRTSILTCWGTSEGGGTFSCPNGDGFHVSEDQVIIEPVDEAGAPVAPGQRSSGIYFTNLYNKAQPIIRYYIDDVFEMDDEPCVCGSSYRKVRQVHGRAFEKFRYGAITVHPVTLQLAVLEQPQILEYQILQTLRGAHLTFRSKDSVDRTRLTTKMREALQSYGLSDPEVTIENVAFLERTAAGKLKRFVPLMS
jgi:phenylacetate-coenzyme A ligase PaaK-like adenylate-forming protein